MHVSRGALLLVLAAAIVVLCGAAYLSLGGWKVLGYRFQDDSSLEVAVSEIRVVGRGSGSVTIRPGVASRVKIHRDVRYLVHRPGITFRIEGTVLILNTAPDRFVAVSYFVDAPKGVRVSGALGAGSVRLRRVSAVDFECGSGSIAISGATGTLTLETGSGAIRLEGDSGEIVVKTASGSIKGRGLTSPSIRAMSSSGGISLDLAQPANVRAQASSGSIAVAVPVGRFRVDARVDTGDLDIGIPSDPAAAYHLDLLADSGSISVGPR
jgi:hypothetical protein